MRGSIHALFGHVYDDRRTAGAAVYVGSLDMMLVEDGTYVVHEAGGEIGARGGSRSTAWRWSARCGSGVAVAAHLPRREDAARDGVMREHGRRDARAEVQG